jgi:hypothetical protein
LQIEEHAGAKIPSGLPNRLACLPTHDLSP